MTTIADVARRAGVSLGTVSRVLNDVPSVSPELRERVEAAVQALGYVPNNAARSLRSKRSNSFALLVPDITNSFWTTIARGAEDVALASDYSVLLCNTDEDAAKQERYIDLVISQRVDGVIIAPCHPDAGHLAPLRERSIPTVVIDRRIQGWDVDTVLGDSLSGAHAVVGHLIRLGHRQIAIISGPAMTSTAEDRIAGYCLALAEAGIPIDERLIRRGDYRPEAGQVLTHALLDEGLRPTAIFAANNAIALGVIDALAEYGLRIPRDMALVSFDDLIQASRLFPFLTVVVQPAYDIGCSAARLLLARLQSKTPLPARHMVLPAELIVRHSCGSRLNTPAAAYFQLPLPRAAESGPATVWR